MKSRVLALCIFLTFSLLPAVGERTGWLTVYNNSQFQVDVTIGSHCTKRIEPNSNHTFELPMGDYQLSCISREGQRAYTSLYLSDSRPYTQWTITDWELGR